MGNFEKLSVLVIGVIIVMILVVAIYTWTGDPADPEEPTTDTSALNVVADPDRTRSEVESWRHNWSDPDNKFGTRSHEEVLPVDEEELDPSANKTAPDETPVEPEPKDPTPATERQYTVKSGQTLSHICLEVYGTTKYWPQVATYNKLDPRRLREGMVILLPPLDQKTPPAPNKPSVLAATGGPKPGSTYTVRSGDTIQKIARAAFGSSERWPDIWFENIERVDNPAVLPAGIALQIPN